MAVFKDNPKEWQRLDYNILQNGAVSLYFNHKILEEAIKWFQENKYKIHIFDCTDWTLVDDPPKDIAKKVGMPDHYGYNFNALNDCLHEFEIPDGGTLLVLQRFDTFVQKFPDPASGILEIIEESSRYQLLTGHRLIALAQSDDPLIDEKFQHTFNNVKASCVMWNPKEWQYKNRGLHSK